MMPRLGRSAKVLLIATAAGLAGLSALDPSPGAAAENVYVYWLSGVMENNTACVGPRGLHLNDAYDLVAGGSCQGPSSSEVRMRTYGSSPNLHVTLQANVFSGEYPYPSLCDYIEAHCYQQPSGTYRGTYRYVHAQGVNNVWRDIWAGPGYEPTDNDIDAETTYDSNCGDWEGHHTHQDAQGAPSQPNDLDLLQVIDVWNVDNYIHKWTFSEPGPLGQLHVNYALLFGPAPVQLSSSQGKYMWVIFQIENASSLDQVVTVSLDVTGSPAGCDKLQQLILPGQDTFPLWADEAKFILYRVHYECHSPASPDVYSLEVKSCIREADEGLDYECEKDAKPLIIMQ